MGEQTEFGEVFDFLANPAAVVTIRHTVDAEGKAYLEHAMEQMNFLARAYDRILKVARTLADLAVRPDIIGNEVFEAIQFHSWTRQIFA